MKFTVNILLIIGLVSAMSGCSHQTYEDCILEHVKPGMGDFAVVQVKKACEVKFPDHSEPAFRWWWESDKDNYAEITKSMSYEDGLAAIMARPSKPSFGEKLIKVYVVVTDNLVGGVNKGFSAAGRATTDLTHWAGLMGDNAYKRNSEAFDWFDKDVDNRIKQSAVQFDNW